MALSLGQTRDAVQLGSPISLRFAVQPDAGLSADSSCLGAQVWFGDHLLEPHTVVLTPGENTVHVRTQAIVNEPLVTVQLRGGCAGSVARSYTFFADPPATLAATVTPIDLDALQATALPAAVAPVAAVRPRPPAPRPARPAPKKPVVAAPPPTAAPVAAAPMPVAPAPTAAPAAVTAAAAGTAAVTPAEQEATAPAPRLRMEALDLSSAEAASAAAPSQMDNSEAPTAADTQALLDASAQRMAQMEQQLLEMQTQLTASRTEMLALHKELLQAQNQGLPAWVYALLGLLALALACIAWLLQRLKQERANLQRAWSDTVLDLRDSDGFEQIGSHADSSAALPVTATTTAPAPVPASATPAVVAAGTAAAASPVPEAAPLHALQEILTAQALFDVQEQADFYASIGEHDQAIGILQTHIAQHANASPQAYLELLQLLYRLSRTEAFEHARQQLQQHFHVQAPAFLEFADKGQDLWSGYPEVLAQLQTAWSTDSAAALLRSWLLPHATQQLPRFALAAFEDLLMLYNVVQNTPASKRGPLQAHMPQGNDFSASAVPDPYPLTPTNFLPEATFVPEPVPESIRIPLDTDTLETLTLSTDDASAPMHAPSDPAPVPAEQFLLHDLSLQWPTENAADNAQDAALTLDERDLPDSKASSLRPPQ